MEALKVMKSERGNSQWGLVLRLLSLALVTLLAFSSGVWFGKKLSDADYQRVALEGEYGRKVASTEDAAHGDHDEHAGDHAQLDDAETLSEEEVAKTTQEALQKAQDSKSEASHGSTATAAPASAHAGAAHTADAHAAPKANSATGKPAPTGDRTVASATTSAAAHAGHSGHAAKPDLAQAQAAAQRVAQNASPLEADKPKAESRIPAALPPTVGTSGAVEFTVQVAAYPTLDAAKDHANKLVEKGFPAFPLEANVNGKTVYRVSVGSFKTQSEAAKFRISLMKQADIAAAFVTKMTR